MIKTTNGVSRNLKFALSALSHSDDFSWPSPQANVGTQGIEVVATG